MSKKSKSSSKSKVTSKNKPAPKSKKNKRVEKSSAGRPQISLTGMVKELFDKAKKPYPVKPTINTEMATHNFRFAHLTEELGELNRGVKKKDLNAIADGLGDIIYICSQYALDHGINIDEVLKEIHKANLTKTAPSSFVSTKFKKGKGYNEPNIAKVLKGTHIC